MLRKVKLFPLVLMLLIGQVALSCKTAEKRLKKTRVDKENPLSDLGESFFESSGWPLEAVQAPQRRAEKMHSATALWRGYSREELQEGEKEEESKLENLKFLTAKETGQMNDCYIKTLQNNPDANGQLVLKYIIDQRGYVEAMNLQKSTFADARTSLSLFQCIKSKAMTWHFQHRFKNRLVIEQPFTFGI